VPLDFNQLRELLAAIDQTNIEELTLKSADFELTVRKAIPRTPPPVEQPKPEGVMLPAPAPSPVEPPKDTPPKVPSLASPPVVDLRWEEVKSPMVGTFYRAAGPDEAPFVEVGDRIRTGQTVCIIEAMKLMNEIEAEVSGQVIEILVMNGEPVEYGQPLMRINPG
jgi:acetyl-CoA carboxylase biotin carboxyl carrier protein